MAERPLDHTPTDSLVRASGRPLVRRIRTGLHPSSMMSKPSWFGMFLGKRIFGRVRFRRRGIDRIRDVAERSGIVYVLQHRSLLDYW
ncbi:MAG: hypothetical protein KC561_00345 [Myxococcales bacterium]|nr:hypothetical protein [Myxococcales bacterium]